MILVESALITVITSFKVP